MSKHLDVDRSIAEWLVAEVPDHAPNRLLEASRARVRSTAQRRSLRPVWRFLAMNSYAKLAVVAAAVVVVAVVGINLAPRLNPGLTGATSSPAPPATGPSAPTTAAPPAAAPQKPVEFTGRINCGPPVRGATSETLGVGDDGTFVTRDRNGAWVQTVTMTDSRLEGTIHHTREADVYRAAGASNGPQVAAWTWRITNDGGTWESRGIQAAFADGTTVGQGSMSSASSYGDAPTVLVGAGGYEGLIAIFEVTAHIPDCDIEVRGIIFQGAPIPEPYVAG